MLVWMKWVFSTDNTPLRSQVAVSKCLVLSNSVLTSPQVVSLLHEQEAAVLNRLIAQTGPSVSQVSAGSPRQQLGILPQTAR